MKISFFIEVLPCESWIVFECLTVVVWVFQWNVSTKCVHVAPTPDDGVAGVHDHSRGIELVGVDVVGLNRARCRGFLDYRHRNIIESNGFL